MERGLEREVRRFATRVRVGAFLGGMADGLAVGAVAFAAILLVLRILGVYTPVAPWWLAPPLGAALAAGVWRSRHVGFGRRLSAQHLDRRLGLDGLLLSACEVDTGAWRDDLRKGLERAAAVGPQLQGRRLLFRALGGLAVLLVVAVLPAPSESKRRHDALGAEVLEALEQKLDALAETESVDATTAEELRRRLADVKDAAEEDGVLSWSDIDTLDDQLRHERALEAGRLAEAAQDLADLAQATRQGGVSSPEDAAKALERALEAGLLDGLSPELQAALGLSADGSGIDPAALAEGMSGEGLSAEALAQLAAALAEAAGDQLAALEGLEGFEGLEGLDLADLDQRLEELLGEFVEGEPCTLCEGGDDDCPG